MASKQITIFDIANDISENNGNPLYSKQDIDNVYNIWFFINYFKDFPECVGVINLSQTMKIYLDKYQHYLFLHSLIPKQRRFKKFKKKEEKDVLLYNISYIYGYTFEKAKEVYSLFNLKQGEELKNFLEVGGKKVN